MTDDTSPDRYVVPLDPVQRLTAERMMQSHLGMARVTILGEADSNEIINYREKLQNLYESEKLKITITHILLKIIALALKKHPEVNSRLEGSSLIYLDDINIGLAYTDPGGRLVVPVFKNADKMSVRDIAINSREIWERLQQGKMKPQDMQNGTFTFTNLGMYSSVSWTVPLINPPQCAILGAGAVQNKLYLNDTIVRSKTVMGLSLTHDHRILNGYPAAAFLQEVVDMMANLQSIESDT